MLTRTIRLAASARPASVALARPLSTTVRLSVDAAKGGLSQGHVNHDNKSGLGFGKEKDVQSATAGATKRSGGEVVSEAANSVAKEAESDADTANQAAQSGSFQSHRGGVEGVGASASSHGQNGTSTEGKGQAEEAAAPSIFGKLKQGLGLNTSKEEHQESKSGPGQGLPQNSSAGKRQYSTSTRSSMGLSSSSGSMRSFATSVAARAEGDATNAAKEDGQGARKAGHEDEKLGGDQSAHIKHKEAGAKDSGKGNAAPNPSLPSNSRSFSTSTRDLADPKNAAKRDGESVTGKVNEDQKVKGDGGSEGVRKEAEDAKIHGEGEAGPNASIPSSNKSRPSQAPGSGTAAPTRLFSTSARAYKQSDDLPPVNEPRNDKVAKQFDGLEGAGASGGYVGATKSEAEKDGYNAPSQANPSANYYDTLPAAPAGTTPSSVTVAADKHSSTSNAPAHPLLAKQAEEGTLAKRNPPPDGKVGEVGLDEAWKMRDAEQKSQ